MHICQIVKILRVRCLKISGEDYASAVDENVCSAELFDYSKFDINQVLIVGELSLHCKRLRWILLCYAIKLNDVSTDEGNSCAII